MVYDFEFLACGGAIQFPILTNGTNTLFDNMKKTIALIVFVGILVIIKIFAFCQPEEIKDLSKEGAPFDTIKMPLSYVMGTIDKSSGDVWVHIEDNNQLRLSFIFRYNRESKRYLATGYSDPNAYITPGSMPISNPHRAQLIALTWLRHHRASDPDTTEAYDHLLGKNESILTRIRLRGICAFKN